MKEYETGQRKALLLFFKRNSGRLVSIDEIVDALSRNAHISRSAVYRNVDRLAQEGLLSKTLAPGSRSALFRYIDCGSCERIHLQCERCGRVFHMDDPEDEDRLREALERGGFELDGQSTVLPGTCRECRAGALRNAADKENEGK